MAELEIRPTASSVFSFQNFFAALNYNPSLVCSQKSYINWLGSVLQCYSLAVTQISTNILNLLFLLQKSDKATNDFPLSPFCICMNWKMGSNIFFLSISIWWLFFSFLPLVWGCFDCARINQEERTCYSWICNCESSCKYLTLPPLVSWFCLQQWKPFPQQFLRFTAHLFIIHWPQSLTCWHPS